MKITNLDTDLLLALMELSNSSTTDLAKKLSNQTSEYELKKFENKLRYRLDRMKEKELLTKNGTQYKVNVERVFLTDAFLHLGIGVDVKMGMMLVVYPKDDAIMMRQISFDSKKIGNDFMGSS